MLNVNCIKIYPIILSVTCHGLINFPLTHTNSLTSICKIFKTLQVIIFWVRVTCKMLNVNCIKIHSIIISITCQGWINFHTHTTHTIPLISICEFKKPYELLFFELESLKKMLKVNCIKIYSIILSVTCHGLINFPSLIQIPSHPCVKFSERYELLFFELESLVKCWMWIV